LSHAGGVINRSKDGVHFESGAVIGDPNMRHTAIQRVTDQLIKIYWSRYGDGPEHILVSDEYAGEGFGFGLNFESGWEEVLAEFVESESMSVGETFFLGSNADKGPFAAVVEMRC